MITADGATAVVTGGTDGIGAATALELVRRGASVTAVGRSAAKGDALTAAACQIPGEGSLRTMIADFSEMATVEKAVLTIAELTPRIDILVQTVGILITRAEHTSEGIEKDLAVSYLSRFVFLETAAAAGLLHPGTTLINVAASAPRVPRVARLEFDDLVRVEARVGMKSHLQAQLANDLLTAQAARRYGISAIGYGPGAVDTSIRREIPGFVRTLIEPLFAHSTRKPDDVANDLVDLVSGPGVDGGRVRFADRTGTFPASPYVADLTRQRALLEASLALARKAGIVLIGR